VLSPPSQTETGKKEQVPKHDLGHAYHTFDYSAKYKPSSAQDEQAGCLV
jgi:hypothetical protein